jgi:hypothetical protein
VAGADRSTHAALLALVAAEADIGKVIGEGARPSLGRDIRIDAITDDPGPVPRFPLETGDADE